MTEQVVLIAVHIGRQRHTFSLLPSVAKALQDGSGVTIRVAGYDGERIPQFTAEVTGK